MDFYREDLASQTLIMLNFLTEAIDKGIITNDIYLDLL